MERQAAFLIQADQTALKSICLPAPWCSSCIALGILAILSGQAASQKPIVAAGDTPQEALRVFIDCQDAACDFDHFRREIPFVNYVRDRTDAEVHVLITGQDTGAGGREFTLTFLGRRRFAEKNEVVRYTSGETDTADEVRDGLTRTLRLVLLRYVAETPFADRIRVVYLPPAVGHGRAGQLRDPWNYWVFRLGANASLNGERATSLVSLSGDVSANRTTEDWKLNLTASGSYSKSRFDLADGTTLNTTTERYQARGLLVGSLGSHFSAGVRPSASSSTFSNVDFSFRFAPALEYDVFPYAESTRRQLRFLYSVGLNTFNYGEETIFNKMKETLLDQLLTVSLDLVEPWGSANLQVDMSHYLSDFSKNRAALTGNTDIRVFRGLSVSVLGSVSHIADQLNLPKGGVTDEEILLRLRELSTSFQYFVSLGLSYTFGSIYSNVVNPRFGS